MKGFCLFLVLVLFVSFTLCHNGRQFTVWNPVRSTDASSSMLSYKPCKVSVNKTSFSLVYDEFFFAPAISNAQSYKLYQKKKVNSPPYVNKQLFVKLSHLWENLDKQNVLPPDQCYTTYIDVNSVSGDLIVGLRSRGFGPDPNLAVRDKFVGFRRFASVDNQSPGSVVEGIVELDNTLNVTSEVRSTACNLGSSATCPSEIVTNYRIAVEVCNKTTVEFVPVLPLGVNRTDLAQLNRYTVFRQTLDVDLRGVFEDQQEINLNVFNGNGVVEFFSITAKVLPTKFGVPEVRDTRNLYSVVMDGNNLNPANLVPGYGSAPGAQLESDSCGAKLNYDAKNPKTSTDEDFLELFCLKLPEGIFKNDTDYLIDTGLWAESSPAERNKFHSVAIGIKSENKFIGFNRRGFMNNRLGDVITAKVNSNGLYDVEETYAVLQNKPIDGSILRSNITSPFFNVKISVYGKDCPGEQQGVSVFAGTPDCPPHSLVWDTLGQYPFNWASDSLSLCVYQQSKIRVSDCIDENDQEWVDAFLPQSTNVYGLTASIEQADFGCDGIDLSGHKNDRCGVCGGADECVGCDDIPHSGSKYDGCGVCNGSNNTCCTQVCGVDDHLWDWLLVPHIIDDVIERFSMLNEELENTCTLLGRYNNLCNKNPSVANAFASVDLANHISENRNWRNSCLQTFSGCLTSMSRNITDFVPFAF